MSRKRDEPVRLTRIYTGGGDQGETSLGDGSRVSKTDPRLEAIGAVDELNSAIGWVLAAERAPSQLVEIQNELFDLGADLSVPAGDGTKSRLRLTEDAIERLEHACDAANATLEPLRSFVLPGGSELGSTWRGRSRGGPSATSFAWKGSTRSCRSTSTGSRTCSSSSPALPMQT